MKSALKLYLIQRITLLIAMVILWFLYIMYGKPWIGTYKHKQIEKELKENFQQNTSNYYKLLDYRNVLSKYQRFDLDQDGEAFFSLVSNKRDCDLNECSIINLGSMGQFNNLDSDALSYYMGDSSFLELPHWHVEFTGKISEPILKPILRHENISLAEFMDIQDYLKSVNCKSISSDGHRVSLLVYGNVLNGFYYDIPIGEDARFENCKALDELFCLRYFRSEIYCGGFE